MTVSAPCIGGPFSETVFEVPWLFAELCVCGPFCAIASDVPPASSAATITKLFRLLIVVLLFVGKVLASDGGTASYVRLFVAKSARGVESRRLYLIISK
jgi:hypothetical protein